MATFKGQLETKTGTSTSDVLYPKTSVDQVDGLPTPTSSDSGKVVGVNSSGQYVLVEGGGGGTPYDGSITVVSYYSGNINGTFPSYGSTRQTYIKFESIPTSNTDYDSRVDTSGTFYGLTSYSNKTKVYFWGYQIIINGVTYSASGSTYDYATKVDLTGNYDITLVPRASSG